LKNVLPVMTALSYDHLAVSHGGMASDFLVKRLQHFVSDCDKNQLEQDLLKYCEQDTMAMVAIYQILCRKLEGTI